MAGTIVADIIQSDQSYASSINIASPMVVSNTLTMGAAAAVSGNVNFDSGTLFVDSVGNKVSVNSTSPVSNSKFFVTDGGYGKLSIEGPFEYVGGAGFTIGGYYNTVRHSSINSVLENGTPGGETSRLTFYTAGSGTIREQMRIDGSGYVTKPYQPSFSYQTDNSGTTTLSTGVVPFNTLVYQVGSNFNTGSYRFTAPVAGVYLFYFGINLNGAGGGLYFRKNGTQIQGTTGNLEIYSNWTKYTTSVITQLSVNDYIDVYNNGSRGIDSKSYNNFCGVLLG